MVKAVWIIAILGWIFGSLPASAARFECISDHDWSVTPNLDARVSKAGLAPIPRMKKDGDEPCASAIIRGEIVAARGGVVPGDAWRFEKFANQNFPFLRDIILDSQGGDLDEAIKIGEIIRKSFMRTGVPNKVVTPEKTSRTLVLIQNKRFIDFGDEKTSCQSACFFIFISGITRNHGSNIGIHRPIPPDSTLKNLSVNAAQDVYRNLERRLRTYLEKMDVDPILVAKMMQIPSTNMKIIERGEVGVFVPGYSQWIEANCRMLSHQDSAALDNLHVMRRPLSRENDKKFNTLSEMQMQQTYCQEELNIFVRWNSSGKAPTR